MPQGIVLRATQDNFKRLEALKNKEKKLYEKQKNEALALKGKIEKLSLTITAQAKDEDEIFGSIGESHISKALLDEGIPENKIKFTLPQSIKKLGVYNLEVILHPKVNAVLRVWVVKK